MKKSIRVSLSVVLVLAAPALVAQGRAQDRDFSKVSVTTEKLADGLHVLRGAGGNIGVSSGPDGVFLVDDQFAPLTEKIRAAVAAIDPKPIRFLLNTHWHGDHTGGNENLGKAGVVIVAHDNVRRRMSAAQFIEFFKETVPASPLAALPIVTFSDAVTFHMNGETIQAIHVAAAHTDGDSMVRFHKADVLHLGDLYFNGMYPYIDVATGGSVDGVIAAVDKILPLVGEKTRVIPGHGPTSGRAELVAYRDMLVAVRDKVRPLVAAGRTVEQVVAAKPTQDLDARLGGGFLKPEQFVALVYASLKKAQ